MLHLTMTGVNAGAVICGDSKVDFNTYAHAMYGPSDDKLQVMVKDGHACPRCVREWLQAEF